jgi:ATP-binding cassette subfamily B protein
MSKKTKNETVQADHGPMGSMILNDKPKNFKETLRKLLNYLRPYRISIIIVIVFAFGSAAFSIIGPKILGKATTKLFEGLMNKISGISNAGIDFTYIGKIMIILLGLYIISAIFSFIQGYIMANVSQKVSFNLRKAISEKINKLPLKYFDKHTHGEVLSRITNDVDTLGQTLSQSLSDAITSVTTIIGVLIMMLSINVLMTVVSLLVIPIGLFLIAFVVKKSQKHFQNQQAYLADINGYVEEIYGGHSIIKAFNQEKKSINSFNKLNDKLYNTSWKAQFLSGMMMPIMTLLVI